MDLGRSRCMQKRWLPDNHGGDVDLGYGDLKDDEVGS